MYYDVVLLISFQRNNISLPFCKQTYTSFNIVPSPGNRSQLYIFGYCWQIRTVYEICKILYTVHAGKLTLTGVTLEGNHVLKSLTGGSTT